MKDLDTIAKIREALRQEAAAHRNAAMAATWNEDPPAAKAHTDRADEFDALLARIPDGA